MEQNTSENQVSDVSCLQLTTESLTDSFDADFDKELFIQEIRNHRCLWDTNNPSYKDRNMKANAWTHLSIVFHVDGEFICCCEY